MSNLIRYGQTALDKTFPDADESVFGHMVLELGMSPDEATQNLRPWVRDLDRSAELSKKTAYVAAFIGAGAGLATAATMGIGLTAILPIAAAAYNFFAGQQSAREQGVRESEYLLLKTCPELLKLIYALTQKGMPKEALVECYDDLLGAFTMQFQQRASLGMSDELDHDIVRSFQRIVQEKCEAESLARVIVAETENFTFDTLYQSTEPKTESLPAATDLGPTIATSSPIGAATKLGAVEVPASPAAQPSAQCAKPFDVTYDLGTHPQSALIAGVPGAGKGMIASNAIRHMKAKRPELTVMVIDPKADQKESGYWAGVANVVERLAFAENDPDDCAAWLLLKIQQFQSLPTPKLLVMDEGAVIVQFLKLAHKEIKAMGRLKAFIAHISSMGDSAESWLWFITQMVNVDDLGISGGFRSIFRAIAVVAPKNINAVNAFLATTFVPMPSGGMEEIMSLMKQSPVNRAFYDGKSNQWYWMPELENHSGYDRDSRTHVKGMTTQTEKPSVDPRASLEKLYQETQTLPVETDEGELAIRAEVKRFLLANADGSKPRDLSARARKPVKGMATDDIKFVLDLMTLEGDIYEVDGTYFANTI